MIVVHTENSELIAQIMHQAFKQYTNPASSAMVETSDSIQVDLANGEYALVGLNNDGAVATIRYTIKNDVMKFFRLGVLPEQRGRNYGRVLVQKLAQVAREKKATKITCDVRAAEEKNIHLYQSCGFEIISTSVVTGHTNVDIKIYQMTKNLCTCG